MTVSFDMFANYAVSKSFDCIEMTITNWGNLDVGTQDATSITIPTQLFSLSGVSIAPSSRVDRCLLRAVPPNPSQTGTIWSSSGRLVSVDQPYFGKIPSPWTISSTSTPEVTFNGSFVPLNTASTGAIPFGPSMGNDPSGNPIFQDNILVVRLFLKSIDHASQSKRPAYEDQGLSIVPTGILRAWPVHGRTKARVNVKVASGTANVSLTSLPYAPPVPGFMNEVELVAPTAVAANGQATFLIDLYSSWLMLRTSIAAGAPTIEWAMVTE